MKKPSPKWAALLLVAFFFGFPFFGMLYFWADVHNKIRNEAVAYVGGFAPEVFTKWNGAAFADQWSATSEQKLPAGAWADWAKSYGEASGPIPRAEAYSSFTSERADMMWQVVKLRVRVPGKVKPALVDMQVARLSEGPRWHVERLEVKDGQP